MTIGIISDSHDNIPNIDEYLRLVPELGITTTLHCGDVCAPSVLKYLAEHLNHPIHLVFGNVDGDQPKMTELALPNVTLHGDEAEIELDGLRIGMVHYPERARELATTGRFNFVFYGHNHKPWEELIGTTRLANPGTLAGLFARPTFAVLDTTSQKLTLKILYATI